MTVTANTTRNDYTAGSAQSVYNYTFQLNEAADVDVYLDGVKQTLNTHYTVQNVGNASGGTITFTLVDANNNPIHPTQGAVINIVMAMDLDRDTNYQPSGAFLAADVNNDFDRLWHASNQQQTAINRSLRLQDTDVTTSSMELPLKDARKGKLLAFNASTGDPEATSNNQSNWDAAYNDKINSAAFSGSTLTLTQQDGGTVTASHTPYLPLTGGTLTGDVEFGASKAKFLNLEIFNTIGNNSFIKETGSGNLFIQGDDLRFQTPTNRDIIKGVADGGVTLYYNGNPKLATTNGGISVTGTLSATGYNSSNWDTAYNDKINSVSYSNNTLTLTQQDGSTLTATIAGGGGGGGETLAQTLAIGNTTGGNDISFGDNDKAKFGASDDLQIYHDGSNSYISEQGTGDLILRSYQNMYLKAAFSGASDETFLSATGNGAVNLFYNNSTKLATTSTGIDVTGTATMDGLSVDNGTQSVSSTGNNLQFNRDGGSSYIEQAGTGSIALRTDAKTRSLFASNGDISFYEDTGTTPKFFWDASAERLGIGTSSPSAKLSIHEAVNTPAIEVVPTTDNTNADSASIRLWGTRFGTANRYSEIRNVTDGSTANNELAFDTNGTERLRIDSSGNVGIGTSSPSANLHVDASAPEFRLSQSGTAKVRLRTTGDNYINTGQNLGIGTSGPATKLDVEATQDTVANILSNGSYAAKFSSSTTGDTGTTQGILLSGVDAVARGVALLAEAQSANNSHDFIIATSAASSTPTERMRIDSTGNVGIGTTNPSRKLVIQDTGAQMSLLSANTGSSVLNLGDTDDDNIGRIQYDNQNNKMLFRTNTVDRLIIDSSGNLLVGKTNTTLGTVGIENRPDGRFTSTRSGNTNLVLNRLASDGSLIDFRRDGTTVGSIGSRAGLVTYITSGGAYSGLDFGADINPMKSGALSDGQVNLGASGQRFKDLYLSGKVYGDGSELTNLPAIANVVEDTTPQLGGDLDCNSKALTGATKYISNTGTNYNPAFSFSASTSTGMYQPASGAIGFSTNTSERMRITSSGNIGIGTTTPLAKLHVNGQSRASNFYATNTGSQIHNAGFMGGAGLLLRHSVSSSSTTFQQMLEFRNFSYGVVGSIKSNGSATQYNTSSDERLKENIQDSGDAGSKIDAIQIRQFDWKGSGEHQDFGVIAQELQTVAPEAVSEGYTEDDIMGVDYSKLVPTLIKEIQTLRNRVAQLENN